MRGNFIFYPGTEKEIIVPNIITDEGELSFLKMIGRADVADIAAGADFFMGLCEEVPADADTLTTISTEPTSAGGYARQPISRDNTGWPVVGAVGDAGRIQSLAVIFTASGATFSRSFQRAFLCNVVSGTSGLLFAYSGLLPKPVQLDDGDPAHTAKYELYLR